MTTITPGMPGSAVPGAAAMDPRIRARREAVAEQERQQRLGGLLFVCGVVMVGLLSFALLKSAAFDVERIRVETVGPYPSSPEAVAGVVTAADIANGTPLIDVPIDDARARVAALPWVESVTSSRSWGGDVTFTITPRESVAQIRSSDGRFVQLDRTGRVIGLEAIAAAGIVTIDGMTIDAAPGHWLDGPGIDLVSAAAAVPPDVATATAALEVDAGGLLLRLRSGAAVVVGDARDLDAKFDALRAFLVGVNLHCLERLDIRAPSVPVIQRDGACVAAVGLGATPFAANASAAASVTAQTATATAATASDTGLTAQSPDSSIETLD